MRPSWILKHLQGKQERISFRNSQSFDDFSIKMSPKWKFHTGSQRHFSKYPLLLDVYAMEKSYMNQVFTIFAPESCKHYMRDTPSIIDMMEKLPHADRMFTYCKDATLAWSIFVHIDVQCSVGDSHRNREPRLLGSCTVWQLVWFQPRQ